MAWIKVIHENEATGSLEEMYARNREPWGGVDNILKIHSLAPETLTAHLALYKTVMHAPGLLSRSQREISCLVTVGTPAAAHNSSAIRNCERPDASRTRAINAPMDSGPSPWPKSCRDGVIEQPPSG